MRSFNLKTEGGTKIRARLNTGISFSDRFDLCDVTG